MYKKSPSTPRSFHTKTMTSRRFASTGRSHYYSFTSHISPYIHRVHFTLVIDLHTHSNLWDLLWPHVQLNIKLADGGKSSRTDRYSHTTIVAGFARDSERESCNCRWPG
jgi:hypothetical protein